MAFLEKKELVKARQRHYAVGAFNFCTVETLQGIVAAAAELKKPAIVSTSEAEMKHIGPKNAALLVQSMRKSLREPVILHLDHGKSLDAAKTAILAGYDAVHIDASLLEYKENIRLTKKVVSLAHKKGISVEAELGHVGGTSSMHRSVEDEAISYTEPSEAKEFVNTTGCDSLAISIGNVHGVYANMPHLKLKVLAQISKNIRIPLVLHGGSGIPANEVKGAIRLGIAKVNVNTENRIAYADAVKRALKRNPKEVVPYKMNEGCAEAVKQVTLGKIKMFS
jgi:ketose-bisphosphate aldolase